MQGAAALTALGPEKSTAWIHGGSGSGPLQGWNTLPLGAGGLTRGIQIAADGTAVVRTDVGNAYIFSGKMPADFFNPSAKWIPLVTGPLMYGIPQGGAGIADWGGNTGAYELVIAPSKTNRLAMFANDKGTATGTTNQQYLYWIDYAPGAQWTQTSFKFLNAFSNGASNSNNSSYSYKIAFDPANENVCYFGWPPEFNVTGTYLPGSTQPPNVTVDGFTTIKPVTVDGFAGNGATPIGVPASSPGTTNLGVNGIIFDPSQGTTTNSGVLCTKHILIPFGGMGLYESTDGGATFIEIGVAAMGSWLTTSCRFSSIDANGVIYFTMSFNGTQQIWRYHPLDTQPGTVNHLLRIDNLTNWTTGIGSGNTANVSQIGVNPAPHAAGSMFVSFELTATGGGQSSNADAIPASNIVWTAGFGANATSAPSYDATYLSQIFLFGGASAQITISPVDGVTPYYWFGGAQGAIWYFSASDFVTPVMPNFSGGSGGGKTYYSVTCSRGTESAVGQDIVRPSGASYPVMGSQDVGVLTGTWSKSPTKTYALNIGRYDVDTFGVCASDPSFIAARCSREASTVGASFDGYSTTFGTEGSWVPWGFAPGSNYQASVTGAVTGSLGSPGLLTVSAIAGGSGPIVAGMGIYSASAHYRGMITSQATGTPGGIGTYNTDTFYGGVTTSGTLQLFPFGSMPDNAFNTLFNGSIVSDGNGTTSTVHVTSITSGQVLIGQSLFTNNADGTQQGSRITAQLATSPGDVSTWTLTGVATSGPGLYFGALFGGSEGGQYLSLTHDIHLVLTSGLQHGTYVARTENGTQSNCTWSVVSDLPYGNYTGRTYVFGGTSKSMACDATDPSKVLCILYNGASTVIKRSTNYGKTFPSANDVPITLNATAGGNIAFVFLLNVPGKAGHFWLAVRATAGSTNVFFRSTDGGATWTTQNLPSTGPFNAQPLCFSIGAPKTAGAYPTLYMNTGGGSAPFYEQMFYSTDEAATWHVFGPTGFHTDLPPLQSVTNFQSISADPATPGLLYVTAGQSGFAYGYFPNLL